MPVSGRVGWFWQLPTLIFAECRASSIPLKFFSPWEIPQNSIQPGYFCQVETGHTKLMLDAVTLLDLCSRSAVFRYGVGNATSQTFKGHMRAQLPQLAEGIPVAVVTGTNGLDLT